VSCPSQKLHKALRRAELTGVTVSVGVRLVTSQVLAAVSGCLNSCWIRGSRAKTMSDSHYIHIGRHTVHPMWRFSFVSRFIGSHLGAPVSVLAEQASQAARVFTDSWNKFLFRRFWGESISSRDVDLVIDSYENVVLRNRFRWRDSARKSREDFTGEVV